MLRVIYAVLSHDIRKSLNGRKGAAFPTQVSGGHGGAVVSTDEEDLGRFTLQHVIVTRYS